MGLFDQVVGALSNPNQQASTQQLSGILGTVQHLASSQGVDPSTTQTVVSVVGRYVRSALQQQQSTDGREKAQALVDQFSGTSPNAAAIQALFTPQQQQQLAEDASQQTGLNTGTIQSMLPILVPLALNLLKTGASNQGSQAQAGQSNSVLNAFLDSDGDGDVDLGDTISMASRFLNQPK
ncbi:MAG: DUF937 domain-containing protein [Elainellaceae cyanobacterium]